MDDSRHLTEIYPTGLELKKKIHLIELIASWYTFGYKRKLILNSLISGTHLH